MKVDLGVALVLIGEIMRNHDGLGWWGTVMLTASVLVLLLSARQQIASR